jgi:hypothetical protein
MNKYPTTTQWATLITSPGFMPKVARNPERVAMYVALLAGITRGTVVKITRDERRTYKVSDEAVTIGPDDVDVLGAYKRSSGQGIRKSLQSTRALLAGNRGIPRIIAQAQADGILSITDGKPSASVVARPTTKAPSSLKITTYVLID